MIDIKAIIKEKKSTISAVAKEMGITQSALSQQINNGTITLANVERIAEILGITMTEFIASAEGEDFVLTCPYCKKNFVANIR